MRKAFHVRLLVALALLAVSLVSFTVAEHSAPGLFQIQIGPALARLAAGLGVGAVVFVTVALAATFVFGRVFCAAFCPLGTAQEILGWVVFRRKNTPPNIPLLRYGVAAATLLPLAAGTVAVFRLFEPFTVFGAAASVTTTAAYEYHVSGLPFPTWQIMAGGVLPLLTVVILVIWKRRMFCTALCPVGTVLGLAAKWGVLRVRLKENCAGCGRCAEKCPAGCIDVAERRVDNERCLRCFKCIRVCGKDAVAYGMDRAGKTAVDAPVVVDCARRRFLAASAVAGLAVAGAGLRGFGQSAFGGEADEEAPMLPPGAMEPGLFARRCTGCQLCVTQCPGKIIKPAAHRVGPVHVDMTNGRCEYDCARCVGACPTGALGELSPERKKTLRIGLAAFNGRYCQVVREEEPCGLCAMACPTGALTLRELRPGVGVPELAPERCIGCGACQLACPARTKAMTVRAVDRQEFIRI